MSLAPAAALRRRCRRGKGGVWARGTHGAGAGGRVGVGGAEAGLVGEALMRADDPRTLIREMTKVERE